MKVFMIMKNHCIKYEILGDKKQKNKNKNNDYQQ